MVGHRYSVSFPLRALVGLVPIGRLQKREVPQRVEHARQNHGLGVMHDRTAHGTVHPGSSRTRENAASTAHLMPLCARARRTQEGFAVLIQINAAAFHRGAHQRVAVGLAALRINEALRRNNKRGAIPSVAELNIF